MKRIVDARHSEVRLALERLTQVVHTMRVTRLNSTIARMKSSGLLSE